MITSLWYVDTLILLSIVIYLVYKYSTRNYDYWEKRKIFYIEPKPIFGNFYAIATFKETMGEYFARFYNSTKEPFLGIFIFDKPTLLIRSPEIIKNILVKDFNNFDDRTILSSPYDSMSRDMLFPSKNPDWKIVRTKMTPVFTSGKLKGMLPLMNHCGEEMKAYLRKHVSEPNIEIKEVTAKYSTDVIAKCAFGINAHCFDNENADFRRIGKLIFDFSWRNAINQTSFFLLPGLAKLFRMKFLSEEVSTFLRNVFWKAIENREKSGLPGNDLIDSLIDIRKHDKLSKDLNFVGDKVVAQAAQFFLAGFETTSSVISYTLYELCIHPHIQHKLRSEIISVLKEHKEVTYEAINCMKYLDMCISETLRKYPVLPFLDRRCRENYTIPGTNTVIEKGMAVFIPMFGLHYDEEYFPHPQKYIPERFSEENINKVPDFAYIPFGEGPRNCVGARFGLIGTKIGLIHILSEFEVIRTPETPVPIHFEPKSFILQSKVGLPMKLKKCSTSAA